MCTKLKYEFLKGNTILFRYGDLTNKYYIILKGKISIVFPHEIRVRMTVMEYFRYLINLKIYGEMEIYNNSLSSNQIVISIYDKDIDLVVQKAMQLKKEYENYKNIKSSNILYVRRLRIDLAQLLSIDFDHIQDDSVSINEIDYCERIRPIYDEKNSPDKLSVTVYEMKQILTLEDGEKFGDYSKVSIDQNRTATIMGLQDSHLAILERNDYELIIKEIYRKIILTNIQWLQSNYILGDIEDSVFLKKYFSYFIKCRAIPNTIIVEVGQNAEFLFFLKRGTYEIIRKFNLIEIRDLIEFYKGKNNFFEENERMFSSQSFRKYMLLPRINKMAVTTGNDIVGLEETIFNNTFIFTVKCLGEGEYFKIERKNFTNILLNELNMKKKIDIYVEAKRQMYLERLMKIRKTLIDKFDTNEKIDEVEILNKRFIQQKNETETLKKYANSQFNFFNDPNINVKIPSQITKHEFRKLKKKRTQEELAIYKKEQFKLPLSTRADNCLNKSRNMFKSTKNLSKEKIEYYSLISNRSNNYTETLNSITDLNPSERLNYKKNKNKNLFFETMISPIIDTSVEKKNEIKINKIDCLAVDRYQDQKKLKKVFLTEGNKLSPPKDKVILLPNNTIKKFNLIQKRIKNFKGKKNIY